MSTSQPAHEINGLRKHGGGVKSLTDVGFRLLAGEHATIVSNNSAGAKSTFVRLITGAIDPASHPSEEAATC